MAVRDNNLLGGERRGSNARRIEQEYYSDSCYSESSPELFMQHCDTTVTATSSTLQPRLLARAESPIPCRHSMFRGGSIYCERSSSPTEPVTLLKESMTPPDSPLSSPPQLRLTSEEVFAQFSVYENTEKENPQTFLGRQLELIFGSDPLPLELNPEDTSPPQERGELHDDDDLSDDEEFPKTGNPEDEVYVGKGHSRRKSIKASSRLLKTKLEDLKERMKKIKHKRTTPERKC